MLASQFAPRADEASTPSPIGKRLAQLLIRKGENVTGLAERTRLAPRLLARILEGRSSPTVDVLWKIANALDVRLASLLSFGYDKEFALTRGADTPRFQSRDGGFVSRALSPFQCGRPFEFYGIELASGGRQRFEAHPPRTFENLTVHAGTIELLIGRDPPRILGAGDWAQFQADVPHSYRNVGAEPAVLYLVVHYDRSAPPAPVA